MNAADVELYEEKQLRESLPAGGGGGGNTAADQAPRRARPG